MPVRNNFSILVVAGAVLGLVALPYGSLNEQPRPAEALAYQQNDGIAKRLGKDPNDLLRRFDRRENALEVIGEFFGERNLFSTTNDFYNFLLDLGFPARSAAPFLGRDGKNLPEIQENPSTFSEGKHQNALFEELRRFKIHSILVTIPDPENSHFAYMYDRQVEAIKRAADENGFLLDRYWTPWDAASKRLTAGNQKESDLERDEKERRKRTEPGLLLFRKGYERELLVVLLVGESPTAGINKEAFWRAREYRLRLLQAQYVIPGEPDELARTRMNTPLTIVSPTFSGSLPSLRLAITRHRDESRAGGVNILNGSAQNPRIEQELMRLSNDQFKINYYTTKIAQDVQGAFFKAFYKRLGVPIERVAVIREDSSFGRAGVESAASSTVSDEDTSLTYVLPENVFPVSMHLSRIRAAYENDPSLRLPQRASGRTVRRQSLELSVEEPGDPKDSPESFSMMTSQSEELVLANLLSHVSRKNYKLLGIIMTDTRDVLFLGRLIERYCPDVRIFTFLNDAAYSHPDYLNLFYGMLVISDYPLFGLEELSSKQGNRIPTHYFASSSAEGVYYATIRAISGLDAKAPVPQSVKAPWIGIQSSQGIWPVSIPSPRLSDREVASQVPSWMALKDRVEKSLVISPPLSFWIVFLGFLGFSVVHGISFWNWRRNHNPWGRWPFWLRFRWSKAVARDVRAEEILYGLASTGSLVVALFLFGSIFKSLNEHAGNNGPTVRLAWIAAWLAVLVLGWMALPPREKFDVRIVRLKLHLMAGIGLTLFFIACFVWIGSVVLWRVDGLILYRLTSLPNGVTPVIPLLLLMAGLYVWSVGQLARISDYQERYIADPIAMPDESDKSPHAYLRDFNTFRKEIGRGMGRFVFSVRAFQVTATVGLVSAAYLCFKYISGQLILSIEGRGFDLLFLASAIVSVWLGTWGFARMLYLWKQVQRLSRQLDLLPMRDAFAEIGKHLSWKSIWLLETRQQTLSIRMMTIDCLRLLASSQSEQALTVKRLDEIQAGGRRENKSLEVFWRALADRSKQINDLLRSTNRVSPQIEKQLSEAAKLLLKEVLFDTWNCGGVRNSLIAERLEVIEAPYRAMAQAAQGSSLTSSQHGGKVSNKSSPLACLHWLKLSEQLVALRFAAYLRPILLQIRNLTTTLTVGFLMLLMVMASYPFQPRRLLLTIQWGILLITVAGVMGVLVQMQRDPILSRLSGTQVGKVNWNREFIGEIFKFGVVPVVGLLAAEFPQLGSSLFSWVEPLLRGIR